MKLLGKRSLSSALKVVIDVLFYVSIVAGVLLIAVLVFTHLSNDGNVSQNFPVFFDMDASVYEISSPEREVEADISDAIGNLTIRGERAGMLLLPILILFPVLAVIVITLHRLRRVFRRLIDSRPFAPGNSKDLRFIGLAVIVGEVIRAALTAWSTRLVVGEFTTAGVALHAKFDLRWSVVFAGLVLFVVAEVFREGAVMKSDMEAAREIQFSLVSDPEYQAGPVSIHSEMRPADSVGGDYYDVIELGDGRIAFVLADVAGHGLPAALLMALLQGSLRSLISSGLRGAELVAKLNTYLVANTPSNKMITFFYGELDPSTGQLSYVNAGHNPPYLYDDSGFARLGSTSVVLGSFDGAPFREEAVELKDGARVLLFTDGITEAANPADEEYGEERLESFFDQKGDIAPPKLIDRAVGDVLAFCGKAPQADDMTMMVVSRGVARAG